MFSIHDIPAAPARVTAARRATNAYKVAEALGVREKLWKVVLPTGRIWIEAPTYELARIRARRNGNPISITLQE